MSVNRKPTQLEEGPNAGNKVGGGTRFAISGAHVSLAAAFLYSVGFLTSNVHFGAWTPFYADLVSSRYFAAASWFLLWLVGPTLSALLAVREASKLACEAQANTPDTNAEAPAAEAHQHAYAKPIGGFTNRDFLQSVPRWLLALPVSVLFVSCAILFTYAGPLPGLAELLVAPLLWVGFIFIFMVNAFRWFLHRDRSTGLSFGAAWALIALLPGAWAFGEFFYPAISSSAGGGAGWVADVTVSGDHRGQLGQGSHHLVLADFASGYVSLVDCGGTRRNLRSITMPKDEVSEVILIEEIVLRRDRIRNVLCAQDGPGARDRQPGDVGPSDTTAGPAAPLRLDSTRGF